jgi:hypothetical protein
MTLREKLVAVAAVYQAAKQISEAYVSKQLFGNSTKLGQMRTGTGDVQTTTWERAMSYLSIHWPAGAVWPVQVERP